MGDGRSSVQQTPRLFWLAPLQRAPSSFYDLSAGWREKAA